jgi:hypothetical protein
LKPAHFEELFRLFCSNEYRVAQRAAYSVMICADKQPGIIIPFLGKLIKNLQRGDVHDAVVRNTVRVLQNIEIPAKYHGTVANACFDLLNDRSRPIAIRVFAMTVIFNLSKLYPELRQELRLIIESELDEEVKPAFKNRGIKILKALHKLNQGSPV